MLTIVCYSLFTFLGAVATSVWQLAIFRLLAGVGIGGEWSIGGTFVAEEWPEARRKMGAGLMHTGYYVGFFLAAIANWMIGGKYGWRAVFAVGGAPALLIGFIRYGVRESMRWEARARPAMREAFARLFSTTYARRTIVNSLLVFVSMIGLWAGSVYVPVSVTQIALRAGHTAAEAARLASYGTMILAAGTILGCIALPPLAEALGRRTTLGIYFAVMCASIAFGFGFVFYEATLSFFFVVLFFLGLGGANFAMYTLWLPEQYTTDCRASAFAFITSAGRFAGAAITFLVGAGVAHFHTIGKPVAFTAIAFVVGMLMLPLAEETRGRTLPV